MREFVVNDPARSCVLEHELRAEGMPIEASRLEDVIADLDAELFDRQLESVASRANNEQLLDHRFADPEG
ncbi:hypothetical protein [Bradyrhizobium sp. DOA1]|uniref:hypothetical protein n=1 Tax=Bradyrhizobium sp. DOA1 TaxID=1126616 RepID=UPI0012E82880|nr:hypothetical protein [Bradyrhizobium sp. DOA1]